MKTKYTQTLLSVFFIIVCITILANCKNGPTETIEITKYSTQGYLDSLTAALDEKDIILKFDTLGYNTNGNLQNISGLIYFPGTSNGTFSTDSLEKIVISNTHGQLSIKVN